jgi:hypothetical protein
MKILYRIHKFFISKGAYTKYFGGRHHMDHMTIRRNLFSKKATLSSDALCPLNCEKGQKDLACTL